MNTLARNIAGVARLVDEDAHAARFGEGVGELVKGDEE